MNKRILSIILVLTMLVGAIAVMPMTATAADSEVWDGNAATSFAGGDGSEENPYEISDGSHLEYLAQQANAGNSFSGKYFILTNDIVLNEGDATTWGSNAPANALTPIGVWDYGFAGYFNGDGYTISGLYQNGSGNLGLFGNLGGGAVITNLALVNTYVKSSGGEIGALVGQTDRSSEDEILIENVYVEAYVYGGGNCVGGIIGNLSNSVSGGFTHGTVTLSRVTFVGRVESTSYVGGLIGDSRNVVFEIYDCLVFADIYAKNSSGYAAGFVARSNNNLGLLGANYDQFVSNSIFAGGSVSAKSGSNTRTFVSSANGTNKPGAYYCYTPITSPGTMKNSDTFDDSPSYNNIKKEELYGYYEGDDDENDIDWETLTEWARPDYDVARPTGIAENFEINPTEPPKQFANGSGTEEDPYLISDAEQLAILSELSQADSFVDTYFELTADITLTGENNVAPIGGWASAFGGTFDGNGHTISGVHIKNTGDGSGFFACIQGGATIKNLALVDAHVESTGLGAVGALVGQTNRANGDDITISNVYVDADVIVANGSEVAGIIGNLSDSNSSYEGGVVFMDNVVFTGSVTASAGYVAGLVGNARNIHVEMTNCANYGTIKAGGQYAAGLIVGQKGGYYIANCVSAGKVTGTKDVYAIACHNNDTIYNDTGRGIEGAYYVKGIASNGETKGAEEGAVIVALKDMSALLGANANAPESFATRVGDVAVPADCTVLPADKVIYGIGLINGASVRLSSPTGIRFTAILGADYLNSLEGDVSFGIIIAPTDYVKAAGEFTVEALEELGYDVTHKEIKADKYVNEDPASDGYYAFTGVLAPVQEGNYERAFSAIAYVKVGDTYYYSEYNEKDNSRSIAQVAEAAYKDTAHVADEYYQHALDIDVEEPVEGGEEGETEIVTKTVYSPYTVDQRNTLLGFFELGEQ